MYVPGGRAVGVPGVPAAHVGSVPSGRAVRRSARIGANVAALGRTAAHGVHGCRRYAPHERDDSGPLARSFTSSAGFAQREASDGVAAPSRVAGDVPGVLAAHVGSIPGGRAVRRLARIGANVAALGRMDAHGAHGCRRYAPHGCGDCRQFRYFK